MTPTSRPSVRAAGSQRPGRCRGREERVRPSSRFASLPMVVPVPFDPDDQDHRRQAGSGGLGLPLAGLALDEERGHRAPATTSHASGRAPRARAPAPVPRPPIRAWPAAPPARPGGAPAAAARARMSSTRARFASASTSCSSALRRRRSCRRTPATSSNRGRRSSGRSGERLVDHALADEEECVVGQVRGVEQIDEIAEPDPLAVEQVVVLAGPVQPPARARAPGSRPAAARRRCRASRVTSAMPSADRRSEPGEDHVLRRAGPQRTALLAEHPAERVGEVALARAIRVRRRR